MHDLDPTLSIVHQIYHLLGGFIIYSQILDPSMMYNGILLLYVANLVYLRPPEMVEAQILD